MPVFSVWCAASFCYSFCPILLKLHHKKLWAERSPKTQRKPPEKAGKSSKNAFRNLALGLRPRPRYTPKPIAHRRNPFTASPQYSANHRVIKYAILPVFYAALPVFSAQFGPARRPGKLGGRPCLFLWLISQPPSQPKVSPAFTDGPSEWRFAI